MDIIRDVTWSGDVESLRKILTANPGFPLADQRFTCFYRTPLHVAAMLGYVEFAREILNRCPRLLMMGDEKGFTPLHLASARNNVDMVRVLLSVPIRIKKRRGWVLTNACIFPDKDGRTPIHLAAMKNEVKVMELLIQSCPDAIHQKLRNTDETILHLCVQHNAFQAMEKLVDYLVTNSAALLANNPDRIRVYSVVRNGNTIILDKNPDRVSVNSVDSNGNTILHLAAKERRIKMLKYLLWSDDIGVDINIRNTSPERLRALDMFDKNEMDDLEIGCYDYYSTRKVSQQNTATSNHEEEQITTSNNEWLRDRLNTISIVATLVAGLAFQSCVHPPGGVFQDYSKGHIALISYSFTVCFVTMIIITVNSFGERASISGLVPYLEFLMASAVECISISYATSLTSIVPPFYVHNTMYTKFWVTLTGVMLAISIAYYIFAFVYADRDRVIRSSYMKRLYRLRLQQYGHLPSFKRFIFEVYPRRT